LPRCAPEADGSRHRFFVARFVLRLGVRADDVRPFPVDALLRLDCDVFRPPLDRVSPASRRCLLTVRAAISFARPVLAPRFFADDLMCSY
jgi:hypothetical protein